MSSFLSAACLALVVTGMTLSAPVQAHASLEGQAKASVQVSDNRAALTRRYLELTTGGIDKIVQQLISEELAGMADAMPAEQLAWFRANTVIIMRPHMDALIRSLSDDIQTRFTEAELEAFEAVHAECRRLAEAGEVEAYYARNSDFHHCIYRATHNSFLTQEAARLHAMLQPYRRMQLQVRNRMTRSFAEHDAIVAAIRGGDAEAAARALHDHVIVQGDRFHDLIAAMRQTLA